MIQAVENRPHRNAQVGEVTNPTGVVANGAGDVHGDAERVPMEARALVTGWNVREAVRGFEGEFLEDLHEDWILRRKQATCPGDAAAIEGRAREQDQTVHAERSEAATFG